MLNWASRLHEIGLVVSHNSFHKHRAYILANADLPGFTRQQQAVLAAQSAGASTTFHRCRVHRLPAHIGGCAKRRRAAASFCPDAPWSRRQPYKPPMKIVVRARTSHRIPRGGWPNTH